MQGWAIEECKGVGVGMGSEVGLIPEPYCFRRSVEFCFTLFLAA